MMIGTSELLIVLLVGVSCLSIDYARGGLSSTSLAALASCLLGMASTPSDPTSMALVALPTFALAMIGRALYRLAIRQRW